eukprot:Hpha_TRINITY_DN2879_c0_g2::TRINITY_DN2879_c0_g2_i1::g.171280::m.171280
MVCTTIKCYPALGVGTHTPPLPVIREASCRCIGRRGRRREGGLETSSTLHGSGEAATTGEGDAGVVPQALAAVSVRAAGAGPQALTLRLCDPFSGGLPCIVPGRRPRPAPVSGSYAASSRSAIANFPRYLGSCL